MGMLSDLFGLESYGGQNVVNKDATTSSGRAEGYFQITRGTWRDFAGRAGIDLKRYPSALSAPYRIQARVAGLIPMGRWDPKTIRGLQARGHRLNLKATLGQNLAANHSSFDEFRGEAGGVDTRKRLSPETANLGALPEDAIYSDRKLSPETANLGPLPQGVAYGADKTSTPSTGTGEVPAGDDTGPPPEDTLSDLASAFGGLGGGLDAGGGGGGSGISNFGPDPIDANLQYAPAGFSPEELSQDWETGEQARTPTTLAQLFSLPTIGQPASKLKALRDAQLGS